MAQSESTLKFNADISGLKKGLAEANRQIRLANAQFSAASSAMDDWSNSADGLTKKISQLETVQDAEKQKLELLNKQYDLTVKQLGATSKEAQELEIQINRQQTTINKVTSELNGYRSQLENVQNTTTQTISAYDKLSAEISSQESELKRLQRQYANYVVEGKEASDEARKLAAQISNLSKDLNANRTALNNADSAADNFANSMDEIGDAADDAGDATATLSGGFSVIKGAIADLVSDGIRWCIDSLKELATASDEAFNTFQTKTGTSTEAMAEFEEQISELYKNNYGESLNDVADAMAQVAQTSKETDPSKIQELTKNAIVLRDTFGFEINETMRAANMLMDQFGISGEEAFNLIAQGAQNGLNKNNDLLDSINEYSVHYKQLGFTSEEFFNSLQNGAAAGTFSVDKLGDAMKEFGIRAKDTANSTTEGFELIGLDADEMRAKFAAGGKSAQQATQETLTALYSMDDAVNQNLAGVDLFGTMWEDLGIEGVKALTDVTGSADATKQTLEEIDAIKYNDLGNAFSEIGRIIKVDLLQPIIDELEPTIKSFVEWLKGDAIPWIIENGDKIIAVISGIGAAFVALKAVTIIQSIISAFQILIPIIKSVEISQAALNLVMSLNPIGLIVAAIAGLVTAFVVLWNKSDAFREFWIDLWDKIKETASAAIEGIKSFFTGIWEFIKNNWQGLLLLIVKPFSGAFKLIYDNCDGFREFIDNLVKVVGGFFADMWNGISTAAKTAWTFISGVYETAATWFNNTIITPISNFFSNMWDKIKSGASAAWDGITSVFGVVVDWFREKFSAAWQAVKDVFSTGGKIFDGIKDGIVSAFTTVVNAIIRGINKIISVPFNAINKMLNTIRNIDILGIKPFDGLWSENPLSIPQIPELAKGGVLKRGQVGLLEGDGTEAVVPLEKNTQWIKRVAAEMSQQLNGRSAGNSSTNSTVNNYTFNQTNNSPKALNRLEIYRQSKQQTAFIKAVTSGV